MTIDYNAKLAQDYEEIRRKVVSGLLPIEERIKAVETATNAYIEAQDADFERKRAKQARGGVVPIQLRNEALLHRLSDLLMYEDLTWSHPDKMSIVEYPIMSESQEEERFDKYRLNPDLQYGDRQFAGRKKTHFTDDYGAPQVRSNRMVEPYDPSIEAIGEYTDLYDALDNAGLTDRQREAIDLVYFEDMTQEQAASVMGVSQPNVNAYKDAGLRKLREYMTKD